MAISFSKVFGKPFGTPRGGQAHLEAFQRVNCRAPRSEHEQLEVYVDGFKSIFRGYELVFFDSDGNEFHRGRRCDFFVNTSGVDPKTGRVSSTIAGDLNSATGSSDYARRHLLKGERFSFEVQPKPGRPAQPVDVFYMGSSLEAVDPALDADGPVTSPDGQASILLHPNGTWELVE